MKQYETPELRIQGTETRALKPGVAVPVAAIYVAAVTTVAVEVQFAAHFAVFLWTGTFIW